MIDEKLLAAARLLLRHGEIVDRWEASVLADTSITSARLLGATRLCRYMPRLLDVVVHALRDGAYEDATGVRATAHDITRLHASDRIDAGFSLQESQRELAHFESVLSADLDRVAGGRTIMERVLGDAREGIERAYSIVAAQRRNERGAHPPTSAASAFAPLPRDV